MKILRTACGLACIFLLGTVVAQAQTNVIGTFNFDENGNWSWTSNGQLVATGQVLLQINGGGVQYNKTVTGYEFDSSLIGRTYGFYEPEDTNVLSDVVHIDDAWHFSYYSDPGDADLADLTSGSLEQLVSANSWTNFVGTLEIGPEDNNYVTFNTVVEGVGTIQYVGVSDLIPEPATFSLVALGGLALLWRRRS